MNPRDPSNLIPTIQGSVVDFSDGRLKVRVWTSDPVARIMAMSLPAEPSILDQPEPTSLDLNQIHHFVALAQKLTLKDSTHASRPA